MCHGAQLTAPVLAMHTSAVELRGFMKAQSDAVLLKEPRDEPTLSRTGVRTWPLPPEGQVGQLVRSEIVVSTPSLQKKVKAR